jgi:DNA invertase Pin-like site-specific DNA recombinase
MAGRRPNPNSQRERAKGLGISRSTLRRRDKGAKPRIKPRPVERCEPSDIVCEVVYE